MKHGICSLQSCHGGDEEEEEEEGDAGASLQVRLFNNRLCFTSQNRI